MQQQLISLEKAKILINEHLKDPKYKTELCKSYLKHGSCSYRVKCRYAHGEEELISKNFTNKNYKKLKCDKFHTIGYCPYGIRCQYLHEYRNLEYFRTSYYNSKIQVDLNEDANLIRKRLACFEIIVPSIAIEDNINTTKQDGYSDKNDSLNTTTSDDIHTLL